MGSNRVANRFNRKLKLISKVRCISSFERFFVLNGADERIILIETRKTTNTHD